MTAVSVPVASQTFRRPQAPVPAACPIFEPIAEFDIVFQQDVRGDSIALASWPTPLAPHSHSARNFPRDAF
jgi:hypothetical protein